MLKKKIGQMFIITVEKDEVTPSLKKIILEYSIGGIILFQKNLTSRHKTSTFIRDVQKIARDNGLPPLWISIDQEGGGISYLSDQMAVSPGNMLIGATKNTKNAYLAGYLMAKQLKSIGFNMNFSPVLDINNNALNPVIGARSFGSDPRVVSQMGIAMLNGHHDAGLLAVGKHFPGHGDTHQDSHLSLPKVVKSKEALQNFELEPFKLAVEAGMKALMTAHIVFPTYDSLYPASLSSNLQCHTLREQWQYDGLIITDSMEMDAIVKYFGREQGAVQSVQAGTDIVLACGRNDSAQIQMIQAVIDATEIGLIPSSIIDAAYERILQTKDNWIDLDCLSQTPQEIEAVCTNPITHQKMEQIALEGITIIRDEANLLPLDPKQGHIWIIGSKSFNDEIYSGYRLNPAFNIFNEEKYTHIVLDEPSPTNRDLEIISSSVKAGDKVVLLINERRQLNVMWDRCLQTVLMITPNTVVVSLWNPQIISQFSQSPPAYIATYSNTKHVIKALRKLLEGKSPFKGQLPVELNGAIQ